MKNKIIILGVIVFLICFSLIMNSYENDLYKTRYHEHLKKQISYSNYDYQNIDESIYSSYDIKEEEFSSHLPILSFDTNGKTILGAESKEEKEYIEASLKVYDQDKMNQTTDSFYQTETLIRYRGNSSRSFPKKGLRLKLVDNSGNENDYPLLGLSKDHDYVLHGPYLDKTLIRNYLGYNITGEVMDYSPNVRYCEVFINGEYQGVYLLVETIKVSKDRVNISKVEKNSPVSSYLLEVTHRYESEDDFYYLNNFSNYTNRMKSSSSYDIKYPTSSKLTEELKNYIENDISNFEKKLYSYDYDDDDFGYLNYIDIDSFVNYVVLNEFFLNYDAGYHSTYLYKDKIGKYKIVFWDMNNIFDNYFTPLLQDEGFNMPERPWFQMLFKDEIFTNRVIKRYQELRKTILSEEYLFQYIDDTIDYLGPAIERNFVKWGNSFNDENNLYTDIERNIHSYQEAINQMKKAIHDRGEWLDKNIETIKQFSHESKVKEYNP